MYACYEDAQFLVEGESLRRMRCDTRRNENKFSQIRLYCRAVLRYTSIEKRGVVKVSGMNLGYCNRKSRHTRDVRGQFITDTCYCLHAINSTGDTM